MCTYFKIETDLAQNLIGDFFFLTLTVRGPFHGGDCKWGGGEYGGTGLISEKGEALYTELNERAKAATNSYSATGYFS